MNRLLAKMTQLLCTPMALVLIPLLSSAAAQAQTESDEWKFRASIYAWLPSLEGETTFKGPDSPDGEVDIEKVLDSIESAFMGGISAEKGRWGLFSDYIYIDLSNTEENNRSLNFGDLDLPVGAGYKTRLGITGWIWNTAGMYTVVDNSWYSMRVLGGVRFLDLEEELDWKLSTQIGDAPVNSRSGNVKVEDNVLDAIIGVRGQVKFGQSNWSAPYYLDVGTGDSEYSVQGVAGINYAFEAVDVTLSYRYLEWKFDSSDALESLSFSGLQFGVGYRW
jgi:hypothetical protein